MNIVILSEDFIPDPGGIAQWAYGVGTELSNLGYDITSYSRWHEYSPSQYKYNFEHHYIRKNNWRKKRTIYWHQTLKSHVAHKNQPSIVIATTWNAARGVVGICQRHNIKLVTVCHGLEVTRPMFWLKKLWLKRTLLKSYRVIAVSQFTKDAIVSRFKINPGHIEKIPNGVDPYKFSPNQKSERLLEKYGIRKKKIVLTLARIEPRKSHDLVIRAFLDIKSELPDTVYLIAGSDKTAYAQDLKKLVTDLRLDDYVKFLGYISDEEIVEHYNLCDVYIMTSRFLKEKGDSEGFGITFLEANACEKPVIGSRSGGIPDAIEHGVNGYLVEQDSIEMITQKLRFLLMNDEIRLQMGMKARQRVLDSYNWKAITRRIVEILE